MKSPRDLNGRELAAGLCRHFDYRELHQTGSHIILVTETPGHQRLPIPSHKTLKVGTLNAILRCDFEQLLLFVPSRRQRLSLRGAPTDVT